MSNLLSSRTLLRNSLLALMLGTAIISVAVAQEVQSDLSKSSDSSIISETVSEPATGAANDNQPVILPEITTQDGVSSFQLGNGMDVVVIPDHRAPVVTQMVWYRVGAADEPEGRSGIAHFLEHLMFKGTSTHPTGEFSAKVASIGGQENAFTSSDYTAYYQQVAPEALKMVMEFESDRMLNLVLTPEVIVPERDVVLEERRMRVDSSPRAQLGEEANATLFYNHPYRRPIIGWQQEIAQLDLDDALNFYHQYYTPNNAILVVTGDVTPETVRELALETYGKLPKRAEITDRIRPQEPEKHSARVVTLRDARVTEPSFSQSWLVPSYVNAKARAQEGDAEALDLLGEILGGSIRSRLYQNLIVDQGIAASAGAYYRGDSLDDGVFTLYGSPRGDATLEQVEAAVTAEINRLVAEGVSELELKQARNRFLKAVIFARDSQTGMARIYGSTLAVGQDVASVQEWPDRIRAVTAEQIQDVAKRYLQPQIAVTSYLLPLENKSSDTKPQPDAADSNSKSEVKK